MPRDVIDLTPLVRALEERPQDFVLNRSGYGITHPRSKHTLLPGWEGHLTIMAPCGCSRQSYSGDNARAAVKAARRWEETYWQPYAARIGRRRAARLGRTRIYTPLDIWRDIATAVAAKRVRPRGLDRFERMYWNLNFQFARHFRAPLHARIGAAIARTAKRLVRPAPMPVLVGGDD